MIFAPKEIMKSQIQTLDRRPAPRRRAQSLALSFLMTAATVWLMGPAALLAANDAETMLKERSLVSEYNPVLLEFLLEDEPRNLSEPQRKEAIDQLVTALKSDIQIDPDEQRAAALAVAGGRLAQLLGGDTVAAAGAAAAGAAQEIWSSWVDSAFVLQRAGYADDARAFFQKCVKEFPYTDLRGRCALGLAAADPNGAMDQVMRLVDEPSHPVVNAALRILGELASRDGVTPQERERILSVHRKHLEGLKKASHGEAAIAGIVRSGNDAAVPLLQSLTKGMMNANLKPFAQRALLLTFNDRGVVAKLEKQANAKGLGSTASPEDKFQAGVLLLEAGEDAGYAWAKSKLAQKKKKGFAKRLSMSANEPDLRPALVNALVEHGDERARDVLAQAVVQPGSRLELRIAIARLELGDDGQKSLALRAFDRPDLGFSQIRLARALASQGDYSGIGALGRLASSSATDQGRGGFSKKADREAQKRRRQRIQFAIAGALADMDHGDGVPILAEMLRQNDPAVAATAAYSLSRMSVPEALGALPEALSRQFGTRQGRAVTPVVWATVVRRAARRFGQSPDLSRLMSAAADSSEPSVQFLALAARP